MHALSLPRFVLALVVLAGMALLSGLAAATGEINVLTDLKSPFPPGCVAVSLPTQPASSSNGLFDEVLTIPSMDSSLPDARVRIRIWRTGCHDEGFSIVMINFSKLSGGPVLMPAVYAEAGEVDYPMHVGQLIIHPAVGDVGATGNELYGTRTYMLGVDPFSLDDQTVFTPADYNHIFTLELNWEHYAAAGAGDYALFSIPHYDPHLDPPQTSWPILHGRMSGQYTVRGKPFTGLVLQIGEQYQPNGPDTNSVSALLFTYMEGYPFWVIGSLADIEPGFDLVTLDMLEVYGGEFISTPPGSYDESDVDAYYMGTMTLEAIDCNHLRVAYDFRDADLGAGSFVADRLVSLAGYECNPWY